MGLECKAVLHGLLMQHGSKTPALWIIQLLVKRAAMTNS